MSKLTEVGEAKVSKLYIGCDPGVPVTIMAIDETGRICYMAAEGGVSSTVAGKVRNRPDKIAAVLKNWTDVHPEHHIVVEQAGSRPGEGVASVAKFMTSYGILLGAAWACSDRVTKVHPGMWKRDMGLIKATKRESVEMAKRLFPEDILRFAKVLHHNRAEAALIALWGLRQDLCTTKGASEKDAGMFNAFTR